MKKLSYRDLAIFCEQVSMMAKSGVILHSGIQMITDDTIDLQIKSIFQSVADKLSDNMSLAVALDTSVFPAYMVQMVEIGSKSGRLDVVLSSLSTYYNRQHTMMENIKSAILYPFVLILMMLMVLIFLAAKVLPVFEQVFNSLGTQMSSWAIYIMKIGTLFNQYSFLLLILVFIAASAGLYLAKTEAGKIKLQGFLSGRKISEKFALATFTSSMSLMLSSGLDIEQSMKLSMQAITNKTIRYNVQSVIELMKDHSVSFIDAMEKSHLFSNTMTGFLAVGYSSGTMDSAMGYISNLYEEEYQSELAKKVSLIEPVSIGIISFLIGSILVSVMFPLLSILSVIG